MFGRPSRISVIEVKTGDEGPIVLADAGGRSLDCQNGMVARDCHTGLRASFGAATQAPEPGERCRHRR